MAQQRATRLSATGCNQKFRLNPCAKQFQDGTDGSWFEARWLDKQYQDSAGTIPVTKKQIDDLLAVVMVSKEPYEQAMDRLDLQFCEDAVIE